MSSCLAAGRRNLRNPTCVLTATRRDAPKRYYTSVVQNVKCIKAIRVWPGDGRFFTSRTRSRFPLMLRLPAPGGSRFFTVLCFTHLPSPSEPLVRASFAAFLPSPLRDWVLFLHSRRYIFYIGHFTNSRKWICMKLMET